MGVAGLVATLLLAGGTSTWAEQGAQFTVGATAGMVIGPGNFDGGGEASAWWVGDRRLVFGGDLGVTNHRVYSEAQMMLASGDKGPALGVSSGVFLGWDGPVGLQSTIWTLWLPVPLVPFLRADWLPDPWSNPTVGIMLKIPAPLLAFLFSGKGI